MELFDWKKWFTGFIDPTRILKDAGTLIRMVLILGICWMIWLGLKQVNTMIAPKKTQPAVEQITVSDKGKADTKIDSSVNAKKTWKFGILNI